MNSDVDVIVRCFESLTPQAAADLSHLYCEDARFSDPFNDVQGLAAIQGIYQHMYASLNAPRFTITGQVVDGRQCFLTWEFRFRFKSFRPGMEQTVLGGSHLLLAEDGRIQVHRDYWDAAHQFYEKLPVVGSLMRWLKKRANS